MQGSGSSHSLGGAHSGSVPRRSRGAADHGIQLIAAQVERIFREERGRIAAGLIRRSGSFDLAEEALQDAFASALQAWPDEGVPRNPGAWITAGAFRKLILLPEMCANVCFGGTKRFAPWAVSRRPRSPAPFWFPK